LTVVASICLAFAAASSSRAARSSATAFSTCAWIVSTRMEANTSDCDFVSSSALASSPTFTSSPNASAPPLAMIAWKSGACDCGTASGISAVPTFTSLPCASGETDETRSANCSIDARWVETRCCRRLGLLAVAGHEDLGASSSRRT
jgi:hypothetical protein